MISKVEREGAEDYLWFWCDGCETHHRVPVTGSHKWDWNGSSEKPTLTPSILVRATRTPTEDEVTRILAGEVLQMEKTVCHTFVTNGRIQYLGDCTHTLAGQLVDLPEMP